jgi:RNA polymerase sigma-70 factor (ECF subfamily)
MHAHAVMAVVPAALDLDLATQCSQGDRAAQRKLFDDYVDYVHAILYRVLGPNRDVEDLVQDAFLEIFRTLGYYRGEAKLATWIARITARVAYAYLSRKRPAPVWLEAVAEPAGGDPSAERQLAAARAGRRLYALLDQLEHEQRIAFTLHVIEGVPVREVAAITESSVVATKSRIFRARHAVRKDPVVAAFLDGEGEETT